MKTDSVIHELHPRRAFRIARARRNAVRNLYVRLEADGVAGYGEAAPNAFYEETAEGVTEQLAIAARHVSSWKIRSVADIEQAWLDIWKITAPSRAAQCALDLALWDWLARREGTTVAELAWGQAPRPVRTFCTIGLSTPEELEEKIVELTGFPAIKIKSDERADLTPVRRVRELSAATIAVDANCAWGGLDLGTLSAELDELGVTFLEQPVPPPADALPGRGQRLPIMADESCVTEGDVERIGERFDGFNIKLVKCGGLTPALRMARRGRELGLKMMVGCMLESSLAIAAGAVIAQGTDFADLDGAWLIGNDPFSGWDFEAGVLTPPQAFGLGVEPGDGLFGDR